ncbi:MAG: CopY/TcrY family copper transport repressor [Culicoidibacterales bacterium]
MKISNAEWQVMKVVWAKNGVTSREIMAALGGKFDWTPSTVKTLLSRLVEKQCLTTKKEGKKFYYSYLLSEEEGIEAIITDVNEKTCAVKLTYMIAELMLNSEFTAKDLDYLEAIVQEKRSSVVEELTCTCVQCDCVNCKCQK